MKTSHYLQLVLAALAAFVVLQIVGVTWGALSLLVLVVACPLLMFFMMRNMGGLNHHDHQDHDAEHRG